MERATAAGEVASVFRRRSEVQPVEVTDEDVDTFEDDLDPEDRAAEDAELLAEIGRREALEAAVTATPARPTGPWDAADAPAVELPRLDLGGLQLPVPEGLEVRVDMSPEGEVVAATLVAGESAMQLNAFAAPKTAGIWAEVRAEIKDALGQSGGSAAEADGPYGTELRGTVPTEAPGAGIVQLPARFLGVDGPRWFLRALITGPAAADGGLAAPFESALRDVVVVRGTDPMAVRDPLPLALPKDVMEQVEAETDGTGLQMPERGPEITEVR